MVQVISMVSNQLVT